MNRARRSLGCFLATASILCLSVPATAAHASTNGKKNTAIVLGAIAAQQLLSGKTTNGILLGAGAAYAYKQYKDSQRDEDRRHRLAYYRSSHTYRPASSRTYRTSRYYRSRTSYGSGTSYRTATSYRRVTRTRYGGTSVHRSSRLVLTGPIHKDTNFTSRRILMTVNGTQRRVDVPKEIPIYQFGQRVSVHDLRAGDVVRVTAVPTDVNRYRAQRIDVIHSYGVHDLDRDRPDDRGSGYGSGDDRYQDDRYQDDAYDEGGRRASDASVGRSSDYPYTGVGLVQRVDSEEGTFDVRVGTHVRKVYATGARLHGFRGVDALRPGDRVRINGDLDGRDVDAAEVSLLD